MLGKSQLDKLMHPAMLKLLKFQARGKLLRITNAFRSRRRIALSILAILLGCVWLGQTVISVMLREQADAASLKTWLSVSLLLYSVFHLIKIGCRKPVEPFEWTSAEKQNLLSAPLTRTQLLSYRFFSYLSATAAKTTCFVIVMIPDLSNVLVGFIGMFVGLTLVDLIRVLLESIAWIAARKGNRCWTKVRAMMLVPSFSLLAYAFFAAAYSPNFEAAISSPNPLKVPQLFLGVVHEVLSQPFMVWIMAPWVAVVDVILANEFGVNFFLKLAILLGAVGCFFKLVYFIDRKSDQWLKQTAASEIDSGVSDRNESTKSPKSRLFSKPPVGWGGAKAIVWYQLLGAIHYRSTLIFALAIPTFLSCMPLLSKELGMTSALSVIGSVVFYSFLLLPPALMLDFRRDARRLAIWKAAPIRSTSLTIGHMTVPVALMSMFQLCVLCIAVFGAGLTWKMLLAWPLLMPMNVLIIGMENAIFLIHPYRRNQEGVEVFLRTILTFTGKGLLFAVALVLTLLWALASIKLGKIMGSDSVGPIVFAVGLWFALVAMAWISIKSCSRFFERLDVSQDLPAA